MASDKEQFIKKQYVPTGDPMLVNDHVVIYHVKCMEESGRPEAILKMYRHKNVEKLYTQMMQLDYTEWPHIHNVRFFDGNTLVVEDYLKGATLKELIDKKKGAGIVYSESEAHDIMDRICEAMDMLNKIELVHHNLKPSNIFVTNGGHVKFLDFENADPKKPHFNIFEALGRIFHELLTGKEPKGKVTYEGRYKKVIEKCLTKDAEQSFKDIKDMQEHMEEAKNTEYDGDLRTAEVPFAMTYPFQGIIMLCEWILFSFFFQKDNMPTASLFFIIFILHLFIFAVLRKRFLDRENISLSPIRTWVPVVIFFTLVVLIYIGVGRFIVPIT